MDVLSVQSRSSLGHLNKATTTIPINDLKNANTESYVEGEQQLRCNLASLYRLVDLWGWSHGIYNHISARVSSQDEHFLLNPFGMLYSEITASALVKVDLNGDVIQQGSSSFGVNKAGFTLHSAIHEARPDIKCVVHLHTPAAVAVSAMKCGLLPLSHESLICGDVSYHDYQGIFIDAKEKQMLVKNLGPNNKILILHNHGAAVCGETVEECFHLAFNLMAACEAQVRAVSSGLDNVVLSTEEAKQQADLKGGGGAGSSSKGWKTGQLEFEALMRALDNVGYRTGYDYKLLPVARNGTHV